MPQVGAPWAWILVPVQFTYLRGNDMTNSWEVSLGDYLEDAVRARGDATFLEILGKTYSYEDFYDQVMRTAGMYLSLGIKHGDRVCLVLPNCPEVLFSWFGLSVIGAIVIPINTAYKRDELAYIYNNSEAAALVAHTVFMEAAGAAADLAPSISK